MTVDTRYKSFIDPSYIEPHLSTKLYRTTYNYLKTFYSENFFDDICLELKMPKEYLLADDNWISIKFGKLFAESVRKKTNDEDIYRKIGNFFFSPENINQVEYQILKAISPIGFFNATAKSYAKTNQICNLKMSRYGFGNYALKISISEPNSLYDDMIKNTLGIVQAVGKFYDLKQFSVVMSVSEDLKAVEYRVQYSMAWYLAKILMNISIFGGLGYFVTTYTQQLNEHLNFNFLALISTLLFGSLFMLYRSRRTIKTIEEHNSSYYESTKEKNYQLFQKSELLDRRYNETNLLKELSQSLISTSETSEVIRRCVNAVVSKFKYKKIAVFLVSEERNVLYLFQSVGFEKVMNANINLELKYPNDNAKDVFFASILANGKSVLITDVESYKTILTPQNSALIDLLSVGSISVSPIQTKDKKYGLFIALSDKADVLLNNQDKFLLENISNMLALFFENAFNFNRELKLRNIFQKYVPSPVLQQISSGESGILKPTKKNICSIFIDLRNFTTVSESLAPEKLFQLISVFTEFVTKAISHNGGLIDNIVGDEVIALFPQIEDSDDYAYSSLNAVISIFESIENFNTVLDSEGLPRINFGIGIHVGSAFVGTVGCDTKYNFTALGDTVNIASRLQTMSKAYSSSQAVAVISKELICKLDLDLMEFDFQSTKLKGKQAETEYVVVTLSNFSVLKNNLSAKKKAA